jgi:hypothetical protein
VIVVLSHQKGEPVRRLTILVLTLLLLAPSGQAFAHGLGVSQDLPVPTWLYLFGASAVVLISFAAIALFGDLFVGRSPLDYHRANLLKNETLRAVLTNKPFLFGLRLLSIGLFLLIIFSGLLGRQDPSSNFAPTFVWIIWWVGLSFFVAFVGNIWPLVNPWKVLFEWVEALARRLGAGKGLELGKPYPAFLGVWPALVLYAGFAWIEIVFEGSATPLYIALFVLLYSVLTWTGMIVFGKGVWLRNGEVFTVFFDLLARFAPTEVGMSDPKLCKDCGVCRVTGEGCVDCYECFAKAPPEDRELNLRFPSVGLRCAQWATPDRLFFVIFVLASVTFDGLATTPPGVALMGSTSASRTLGLIALPLVFLVVYLLFVKLSQLFGGVYVPFGPLAASYVYSLVPIAIAYQVAHYFTLLLIQGQEIIALLSDPFGWGWDLFGTAGYEIRAGVIGADTVWKVQITLIVVGHVVAIYLAHMVALRFLPDSRRAMRSQYPMLVLMIFYTCFSLWILSQPIVEENRTTSRNASQPSVNATQPPVPGAA